MKVAALVPVKLNNQRFPGKNIKSFTNGEPLITHATRKLAQLECIDAAYVFCSDPSIKEYLPEGINFLERSAAMDRDQTRMNEIITAFIEQVDADVYLLTHVTSPFIAPKTLEAAVNAVVSGEYDSACSVEFMHDFLWYQNKPLTYDPVSIPRTQDIQPVLKETSGVYVFTKNVAQQNRRIGYKPFFVECDKIEAIDIDEEIDFIIADAIYQSMGANKE